MNIEFHMYVKKTIIISTTLLDTKVKVCFINDFELGNPYQIQLVLLDTLLYLSFIMLQISNSLSIMCSIS